MASPTRPHHDWSRAPWRLNSVTGFVARTARVNGTAIHVNLAEDVHQLIALNSNATHGRPGE